MARVVQCVEPSSGLACSVSWTTASTVAGSSQDLRPRPGAIRPKSANPLSAKRERHLRTGLAATPTRRAISFVATPSEASSSAWACWTLRCRAEVDRASRSSVERCSSVKDRAAAGAGIVSCP